MSPGPGSTEMAALRFQSVRFRWPGAEQDTIDIQDWVVARGGQVFVHGPSGTGKSTLMNLIAGVLVAQGVQVLGASYAGMGASERDRFRVDHIGLVFQQFNLIGFLSVAQNIALPCRFSVRRRSAAIAAHGSVEAAVAELMRTLDLDASLARRSAQRLSIGQQQRVALARALIGSPELLLADEPTSALDSPRRDAFVDVALERCRALGTTLLFVSHDERLAERFETRQSIIALNAGGKS